MMINHKLAFFSFCFIVVSAILRCNRIKEQQIQFYRVKTCGRLNTSIIARRNFNSFSSCLSYAIEKNGLGFNFSPDRIGSDPDDYYYSNCEILDCPNVDNLTSLVNDTKFDYYSRYGNTESIINASCIPTVGIFKLNLDGENYTRAENICRSAGGNLANILSESRNKGLGMSKWYRAAYVGLNDMKQEGTFLTSLGEPLSCFKYRAWAPGHPRPHKKRDDCVILDANKTWRTINCQRKMAFVCEIYAKPPFWNEYMMFNNITCGEIPKKSLRKNCQRIKKKYKKAQNTVVKYDKNFKRRCNKHEFI